MGNMKFRVADNATLRFYPKVDYEITGGEVTATTTSGPGATVTATVPTNATSMPTTGVTAVGTPIGGVTETAKPPATTPTPKEPGFEVTLAVTGLLAVAFLVLRQRK
ncbi:Uncharacterised protein [uncultured archaeon]|nr:Uncharacterised protein [uncultured archaeon]